MLPRCNYALANLAYQKSLNGIHKPCYIQSRPTPLQSAQRSVLFGVARRQVPHGQVAHRQFPRRHCDLRSGRSCGHNSLLGFGTLNDSASCDRQRKTHYFAQLEQAVDELSALVVQKDQEAAYSCDGQFQLDDSQLKSIDQAKARVLNALAVYLPSQCDQQGRLSAAGSAKLFQALALLNIAEQKLQVSDKTSPQLQSAIHSAQHSYLELLKSCATAGVVATGVISFWRGIWFLWDGLVFPDDPLLSGCLSASVGLCVLVGARRFDLALAPPLTELTQTEKNVPPTLCDAKVDTSYVSQQKNKTQS